jgi:NAD+ kinase
MSSSRARARLKVALVIKRSQWRVQVEEKQDARLLRLVEARDPTVAALRASHDAHERTVHEVKEVLRALGAEVVSTRSAGESFDATGLDLVVTVGGDGTLLAASHSVVDVPILGVNSAPSHSVGFFCGAKSGSVLRAIEASLKGTVRRTRLTRMKVSVNGRVAAARVLNDALFCHASPAATSRYIVELGNVVEQQKSSGFWIGPAAGSTAAQRSAGGRVLPLTSQKLQLVVREPYTPQGGEYHLRHALIPPDQVLRVRSKIHEAQIFFDGPDNVVDLGYGDVVEFTQAQEDLTILGLTSRRKWGKGGA